MSENQRVASGGAPNSPRPIASIDAVLGCANELIRDGGVVPAIALLEAVAKRCMHLFVVAVISLGRLQPFCRTMKKI